MPKQCINRKLEDNKEYIADLFSMPKTFDLVTRDLMIGNKEAALYFIDGFANGELLAEVMKQLLLVEQKEVTVDVIKKLLLKHIIAIEVEEVDNLDTGIDQVLAGPQLLLIDGEEKGIVIDARTWAQRGPEEPESEKSTRGPNDGFVETMLFNLAMIRRRIRDPQLRAEVFKVGARSKSDVALVYIEDIANPQLVTRIRNKLENIVVDGIPLADKNIEEFLVGKTKNPLPRVRATERPDNAAAHLLEGQIAVLVDNSPTALLLPAPFLSFTQSFEEYRQTVLTGTYLTILRFCAIFISMLLPALWLVAALNPQILPEALKFIGPKEYGSIHLGLQFILASIGIDLIWLASIHTPNSLATSLGLIGALMLGEFSVQVGLFSAEVIFYMAIAAICTFTLPNYEVSLIVKMVRFLLLILAIFLKWWGVLGGLLAVFILALRTDSFGVPYLWPIIPFNWNGVKSYILRNSTLTVPRYRPEFVAAVDKTRQPGSDGQKRKK